MAEIKGVAAGWNDHLASLPGARKVKTYSDNDMGLGPYSARRDMEDWTYNSAYDMVHRGADAGRGFMNAAIGAAADSGASLKAGADAMRGQARLVNTQGDAVNQSADALAALVPQLDPYRAKFDEYGDDLAALAATIQGRADDVFGQGRALVTLDPNAGGLAGEFMSQYDLLSPERYVSRYASDAQSSIDNTRAQTERYLSRRGVDVGSGANAGLMGALQRMKEAALLSAAKTLGYDKGVTERGNWLKDMTGAAKTLYDMGTQQQSQALAAKGAAADMASKGAGIIGQQGGMLGNVAQLREAAGRLFGNAAGIMGDAGKLEASAQNGLADAYAAAAKYYLGASQAEASAAYGGRNRAFA